MWFVPKHSLRMKRSIDALLLILLVAATVCARAQVVPSATARGVSINAGGEASVFQSDYAGFGIPQSSPDALYGVGAFVDVKFKPWAQLEAEGRWSRFNQLAGINAILYYLNSIFMAAGFSQISGDQQAIAIGATNLLFTIVGMSLIDKAGRKTLLLIGAAGTASCLAGVAWIFTTNTHPGALVWLLITYIAFFALSQGAVIWVYIGEVFPNAVRSKGQGVGNASHWIMNTVIAMEFPVLATRMGRGAPFVFFAVMTVVQFVVVMFTYPETKGQTLEALQRKLVRAD